MFLASLVMLCIQEVAAGAGGDTAIPLPTPGAGGTESSRLSSTSTPPAASAAVNASNPTSASNTRGGVWIRRAHLVDPRNSVTGLMFAPRFLGLQLAAVSTDGVMLVYEAQVRFTYMLVHDLGCSLCSFKIYSDA